MLTILIMLFFISGFIYAVKQNEDVDTIGMALIIACTCLFLNFMIFFVAGGSQSLLINACYDNYERQLEIHVKRYNYEQAEIIEMLQSYPLETNVYENFNPEILLSLPEIKSNELIRARVERLLDIQNKICEILMESSDLVYYMKTNSYFWWIVPFYVPFTDADDISKQRYEQLYQKYNEIVDR